MEDSSRDLEKELKKYGASTPLKRSGKWQMLLISEDGKMISVRRYKGLAMILVILLVISCLSTALFSVLYFRSLNTDAGLETKMAEAEKERKALKEENERLETMLFLAEKKNKPAPASAPEKKEAVKKEAPPPIKKVVKKVEKMKATVKDLTVTKDMASGETRIRFIVKNDCELKAIAGRVFVILKPDSDKAQDWLTMPPVTLKDGVPAMPSRGQFFSINNFKSVNFKFNNPLPDNHYKSMDVFIFSTEGNQIFAETYTIDLIVVNKPKPNPEAEETDAETKPSDDSASGAASRTEDTPPSASVPSPDRSETEESEDSINDGGASAQGDTADEL